MQPHTWPIGVQTSDHMVSLWANHKRRVCDVEPSAVLVLLISPFFPSVPWVVDLHNNRSENKLKSEERPADCAPTAHRHVARSKVSPTLESSSADIERKGVADPRPPKQGGGRKGGRWESGWRPERVRAGLAGRTDRTDRGSVLVAPLSTRTPRKQACR